MDDLLINGNLINLITEVNETTFFKIHNLW